MDALSDERTLGQEGREYFLSILQFDQSDLSWSFSKTSRRMSEDGKGEDGAFLELLRSFLLCAVDDRRR